MIVLFTQVSGELGPGHDLRGQIGDFCAGSG